MHGMRLCNSRSIMVSKLDAVQIVHQSKFGLTKELSIRHLEKKIPSNKESYDDSPHIFLGNLSNWNQPSLWVPCYTISHKAVNLVIIIIISEDVERKYLLCWHWNCKGPHAGYPSSIDWPLSEEIVSPLRIIAWIQFMIAINLTHKHDKTACTPNQMLHSLNVLQ